LSSKYTVPSKYLRWFIEDNKIALITTNIVDSTSINSIFNKIDESIVNGILVYYEGSVTHLEMSEAIHKEEPDINPRLHSALQNYILSRLYGDKPDMNEADIISANRHYSSWRKRLGVTNGGKLRYTGPKVTIPDKRVSLR